MARRLVSCRDRRLNKRLSAGARKIAAGEVFHGRATNYRKDGSEFRMEWKVIPVVEQPGAEGSLPTGGKFQRGESTGEEVTYHIAVQREAPADQE